MGVKERRERDKSVMRSRILEAATQLFVELGIANVSIRKIADRIEYSPATIYLYFRDKDQLLSAVCAETFIQLKTALDEILSRGDDPVARLRQGLRWYIDFGLAYPHHYLLTFNTPHRIYHGAPEFESTNKAGLEVFDVLRTVMQQGKDSGGLDFDDLDAASQSVWTFIHGTTSLLILYHDAPDFPWVEKERLIESSLDLILKGLSAKTGVRKSGTHSAKRV